jgi:hypothetical protein
MSIKLSGNNPAQTVIDPPTIYFMDNSTSVPEEKR